jgi:Ca2+-binding RTX toxin-like protein
MDPVGKRGGVSDRQLRRKGRVRGCERLEFANPPARDPARGVTWIGPLTGARKNGTRKNDTLLGATGADRIYGKGGADVIWGNRLHGDPSKALDVLYGGAGADVIYGSPGRNMIYGNDGDDYLQGGKSRNVIAGGPGNDTIRLRGRGPNSVDAGAGNDIIYAYSRKPATIKCGPGMDAVELDKHDKTDGSCEKVHRH